MTVYEEYENFKKDIEIRRMDEMKKLEEWLKLQQKQCKHKEWDYYEELFYALGETAPGEVCRECGKKRHVK